MKRKKKDFVEDLVLSVREDFLNRQKERKPFESVWRLNNNFLSGNQYVGIDSMHDIRQEEKLFYWQERKVYNHIAPVIEQRLAKLNAIKPSMDVMASSSNIDDQRVASLSQDILHSAYEKLNLSQIISKATVWSEIAGTSFYKIVWNSGAGRKIYDKNGKLVYEGDIEVSALSPFEIYPDNNYVEDINECESIIHAKAYSVKAIKNIWGVDVKGGYVDVFDASTSLKPVKQKNQAIVIEKYESPSVEFPDGRLIVVCEDKLLYIGELPFVNLPDGKRGFPFVKQVCLRMPNCFWGKSVIEKLIPVQRAYNAIKNRKHEFINRLSMGVLTVEDGSVDVDELAQEGLQPGKVIVYKQGAEPPKFLDNESLSSDFDTEEENLRNEFSEISGVTNILSNQFSANTLSGTALQLLIEQDTSRLSSTVEEIDRAVKSVAKMILRLYKQFAVMPRLLKIANNVGKTDLVYFKNTDLGVEDVVFTTDSTLAESLSSKREHILKLLSSNVLVDKDGNIDNEIKRKILEIFGMNFMLPASENEIEKE